MGYIQGYNGDYIGIVGITYSECGRKTRKHAELLNRSYSYYLVVEVSKGSSAKVAAPHGAAPHGAAAHGADANGTISV